MDATEKAFERHFGEKKSWRQKFFEFHEKYYWQVICLGLVISLWYFAINFRIMVESATQMMEAGKCQMYCSYGNMQLKNMSALIKNLTNVTK